jgi:hypothetical protein
MAMPMFPKNLDILIREEMISTLEAQHKELCLALKNCHASFHYRQEDQQGIHQH